MGPCVCDNQPMMRRPVVAGRFYPAQPDALSSEVAALVPPDSGGRVRALGVVCPHAGYVYSGGVAGETFGAVEPAETYLMLGPNHTGLGAQIALSAEDAWEVPTGVFEIDADLARAVLEAAPMVEADELAHDHEHSLEVMLPFIAHTAPDSGARILPIAVMAAPVDTLVELGRALAGVIRAHPRRVLMVASSDMNHFLPDEETRRVDKLALERLLALDPEGLYSVVVGHGITMCGVLPVVAMLAAALELGATEARLVRYATSAEAGGDRESVVGYAGVVVL